MLAFVLLKNHAGLLLCGDYMTLRALHEVVHEVDEKSPLVRAKEGTFLGLAYDIRMAYEGKRQILQPSQPYPVGVRFGVELLWPVVLVQCAILRSSLSFFDSTKRQQALTYALEDAIESALQSDFGKHAGEIIANWRRIDPRHAWAEEKLYSRGVQFCVWTKAQRKAGLAGLLASLDPMYPEMYPVWVGKGVKNLVSPEELDALDGTEWPDPPWE
ncbi:DUF6904 family protein [Cupriavidus basilensis]